LQRQANGAESTEATLTNEAPTNVPGQVDPLTETTNKKPNTTKETAVQQEETADSKPKEPREPREPRERKQRGPPEDGVASKTKVMVANLPYDLREEKVGDKSSFFV
jgi:hypothetical protein